MLSSVRHRLSRFDSCGDDLRGPSNNMLPSVARARFQYLLEIFDLGDATSLKQEMDAADCIISGSAALYMLHPAAFLPNDIDFYVPVSSSIDFEYTLHKRGYNEQEGNSTREFYPCENLVTVCRLHKNGVSRTINLITTRSINPLTAVVQFHSTLVMNAITADGVLCLYPFLTLPGQGIIAVDTPSSRHCFAKYIRRGFTFKFHFSTHTCNVSAYCRNSLRSIEDPDVLKIPFDDHFQNSPERKYRSFRWRLGPQRNSVVG